MAPLQCSRINWVYSIIISWFIRWTQICLLFLYFIIVVLYLRSITLGLFWRMRIVPIIRRTAFPLLIFIILRRFCHHFIHLWREHHVLDWWFHIAAIHTTLMMVFFLHFDGHHFAVARWSLCTSLHGLNLYRWWHTLFANICLVIGSWKIARFFTQINLFDEGFDLAFILWVI